MSEGESHVGLPIPEKLHLPDGLSATYFPDLTDQRKPLSEKAALNKVNTFLEELNRNGTDLVQILPVEVTTDNGSEKRQIAILRQTSNTIVEEASEISQTDRDLEPTASQESLSQIMDTAVSLARQGGMPGWYDRRITELNTKPDLDIGRGYIAVANGENGNDIDLTRPIWLTFDERQRGISEPNIAQQYVVEQTHEGFKVKSRIIKQEDAVIRDLDQHFKDHPELYEDISEITATKVLKQLDATVMHRIPD